jgi:quercetin dioxygenase-like cupin family protein
MRTMAFIDMRTLRVREPLTGWKGRFFHSEHMTFAYDAVAAGASIHEHAHSNDEVWNVIEGELEVTIAGERRVVGAGAAAVVPPNAPHSVNALTDVKAIVVDYPLRHSIGGVDLR